MLNKKSLAAIKPAPAGETRTMKDGAVGGLYVQYGSTKPPRPVWMLAYRQDGHQTRTKLGFAWHGTRETAPSREWLCIEDAREKALALKSAARNGTAPQATRSKSYVPAGSKAAPAKAKVATLEDTLAMYLDVRAPKSRAEVERLLRHDCADLLAMPVASITRADTRQVLDAIRKRGAIIVANQVHQHLKSIFRWAQDREMVAAVPLDREAPSGAEKPRSRVLSDDELAKVWRATAARPLPLQGAERILILTGVRREEAAGMRWSEIDLTKGEWLIPGDRAKNEDEHLVPLSSAAVEVIRSQQRVEGSDYVFTFSGNKPASMALEGERLRSISGVADWTLHDLRRTVATNLPRLDVSPDIAERVLGHRIGGMRGVYNRYSYLDEKRDALQRWADHLASITN